MHVLEKHPQITYKIFEINKVQYYAVDALDKPSLVKHRNQSVVYMPNTTINSKVLDKPQDPTFWNRSKRIWIDKKISAVASLGSIK